ncbi:MAG: prenyltransferase/squalene oxidase repeat-containing protein [Gemmatimonadaceae bacterium]
MDWLGTAQDRSASADGGVARHFSLVDGWSTSYPETTGYIVPTMLACAERFGDPAYAERGRRMLDWLVSIQQPDGGFQGGLIGATPVRSVTFNTGQILIGLAAGVERFGDEYRPAMREAARWLVERQDPDGCWRKGATPFAAPGEKAYETHVAWGLFEAARQDPGRGYDEVAMRNVSWALTHQRPNGWFASNCLTDPTRPLTHTIGYVLRGLLEAHRFTGNDALLAAARLTADGALGALRSDGFLPGRLDSEWRGTVNFACLTGSVQLAHCWLMLYQIDGERRYLDGAMAANSFVRRTLRLEGDTDTRGAVKGSFPVSGEYGRYQYLNWAAKFFIDANLLEQDVLQGVGGDRRGAAERALSPVQPLRA